MREEISEVVEGLLRKMVGLLRKHWGDNLVSVVLFGSVARGDFESASDIDLFIVCRSFPREYTKRTAAFVEIECMLWEDMDAVEERYDFYPCFSAILKTQQEAQRFSRLYLDMQEEARILYDRDGFFSDVLAHFRRKLKELGATKKTIGRRWYWDLKPDLKPGEVIRL